MAFVAIGAQVSGLVGLLGYNRERSHWDAQEHLRSQLGAEVQELGTRAAGMSAELVALEDRRADAMSTLAGVEEGVEQAREDRDRAVLVQTAADQRVATATAALDEANTRRAKAEEERVEVVREVESLRVLERSLRTKVDTLNAQRLDLETKSQDYRELTTKYAQLFDEWTALEPRLSRARSDLREAERLKSEAEAEARAARKVQSDAATTVATLQSLTAQAADLSLRLNGLVAERDTLLAEMRDLQAERNTVRGLYEGAVEEYSAVTAQRSQAAAEIETATASIEILRIEEATLQTSLQALREEEDKLTGRVSALRSERDVSAGIEAQRVLAASELAGLRSKAEAMRETLQRLGGEAEVLTGERDRLRGQVAALEASRQRADAVALTALSDYVTEFQTLSKTISAAIAELSKRMSDPDEPQGDMKENGGGGE